LRNSAENAERESEASLFVSVKMVWLALQEFSMSGLANEFAIARRDLPVRRAL
jgi:hypothetical protein